MNCPHCSSDQHSVNVTCANCGVIYKALPNWTGLTEKEIQEASNHYTESEGFIHGAHWAQQKLKEKNHE